jgi:hypothetical protein
MLSHYYGLSGEFALDALAALALLFIGYLLRLQIRQIRRKRREHQEGLRFGLIQDVTALERPLAAHSTAGVCPTDFASIIVPGRDTGSRLWTAAAKTAVFNHQWN